MARIDLFNYEIRLIRPNDDYPELTDLLHLALMGPNF